MANEDDEFGFKSLAEAFKPEVVRQEVATTRAAQAVPPVVSQPVPTRPVTPRAATPSLPEVKPEEVAASVPQMQVPELPPIQNPVFNPEFQKAAGIAALPAALGGAALGAGAAYGIYKGRKSIQDRSIGKPMTAPADFGGNLGKQLQGMDMSRVSPSDLKLLQEYEAKRVARQTAVQPEINKQMGFAQPSGTTLFPTNPVSPQTPPTIQAEIETPKITLPETPALVAQTPVQQAPVAPYSQERMAGMLAGQEMANPIGGQASAYTEPLKAVEPPVEKNKGGRPKGVKTATPEEKAMKEAAKGINMYRNMFGFEAKDPTSAKSLAAIESTNRLIAEGFEGRIPASRDPLLNPLTDVGASGKKFYAGTPEGHRNVYIPWLEKNLNTLPPETQAHVLESMTKGQTKDIGKIVKGLGLAGAALGTYQTAFANTPSERGMAGANLLGAVLPPGADITEAGAPVLPPSILAAQKRQMEEMQKLGSPYRKR